MRASSFLGTALVATSTALVVPQADVSLTKRQDYFDDADRYCHSWDMSDPESAKKLWDELGVGYHLDYFVRTYGSYNWAKELEKYIYEDKVDLTKIDSCAVPAGTCAAGNGLSCINNFNDFSVDKISKNAWWIFEAVKKAHLKMKHYYTQLMKEGLITGLRIDKMVEELGQEPGNGEEVLKWLGLAFNIVGTAMGAEKFGDTGAAASSGLGLLSSIIDVLPQKEPQDISGDVRAAVADAVESTADGIEELMQLMIGSVSDESAYEKLPAPIHDTYETNIAKFFNGGWALVDLDTGDFLNLVERSVQQLRMQIADKVMKAAGWRLYVRGNSNAESCGSKTGRQLINFNGETLCTYMARWESGKGVHEPSEEFFEAMARYGLWNRQYYYENLLDCTWGNNGEWTTDVPKCYYSMEAIRCADNARSQSACIRTWET